MSSEHKELPISSLSRKPQLLIAAALLLGALAIYLVYSWGLWTYAISISGDIAPSPNARRSDDVFLRAERPKGSILLLHGLNFDASKLIPLAELLRNNGYSVLVPRLVGHRGAIEETLTVPTELWFNQIAEWQAGLERPLICVGYSLGGLLVLERQLQAELKCERMILFAPALRLRTPGMLAEFFMRMTPSSFTVPSGIPNAYMHFDHPGLGPTYALTQVLARFNRQLAEKAHHTIPPGLAFIDPRDQVIAPNLVESVILEKFPEWKIIEVRAQDLNENHAFHLIVDEPHVGAQEWEHIKQEISDFLP